MALAVGLVLLIAACSDDDSSSVAAAATSGPTSTSVVTDVAIVEPEPEVEVYFLRIEELEADEAEARDGLPAPSDLETTRAFFVGIVPILEAKVEGYSALDPPPVSQEAHDRVLQALRTLIEFDRLATDRFVEAETFDEYISVTEDPELGIEAQQPLLRESRSACVELENLAADNGVEIDLFCFPS